MIFKLKVLKLGKEKRLLPALNVFLRIKNCKPVKHPKSDNLTELKKNFVGIMV